MLDYFFQDELDRDDLEPVPEEDYTWEERVLAQLLLQRGDARAVFLQPVEHHVQQENLLEEPKESRTFDEGTGQETLEIVRGNMHVQDAVWYCATKKGLLENPGMLSRRLRVVLPGDRKFRHVVRERPEKERERGEDEQRRRGREHREAVELASRAMANGRAREAELSSLSTYESDKLGFLLKEFGKMVQTLGSVKIPATDRAQWDSIAVKQQALYFQQASRHFRTLIEKERIRERGSKARERARSILGEDA